MKSLLLVGAGGHSRSCIDVIECAGLYRIAGVIDKAKDNELPFGYPRLGDDSDLESLIQAGHHALIAVGQVKSPAARIRLFNLLTGFDAILPTIVSPKAYVSRRAGLSDGTIVMHGAILNAAVLVGVNCIVNTMALIEHDVIVGAHCHISTGAVINGGATIGDGTFIGSRAVVREGVRIGKNVVIGAGSVVLQDVPAGTVVRGLQ